MIKPHNWLKFIVVGLLFFTAHAWAGVNTSKEKIGFLKVVQSGSIHYYYVRSQDLDWSASGCPNAEWVYFLSTESYAESFYAALLASRMADTPVAFHGTCTSSNYIYAEQIYLYD